MSSERVTRFLFVMVVTPVGVVLRPVWRGRLGLRVERAQTSYWQRRTDRIAASSLRKQR